MGYEPRPGNLQLEGTRTDKPFWDSVEDEDGHEFATVWEEAKGKEEEAEFKVPWGFSSTNWDELGGLLFFDPVPET
ncbi:hypothetical protein MNV49_005466 [Pseudohyphozyma bogoriensis]|nr:hypothetical protein MNV49_005466 [Pseudohyphozyma bogoriensis]